MHTSKVHSSSLGRAQRSTVQTPTTKAQWCRPAAPRVRSVHVQAMQSGGWNPQQQPPQPMQQVPPQQQQQQQMGQQPRQPLARSPAPYQQPAGAVFLELTQVIWPGPTQGLNLDQTGSGIDLVHCVQCIWVVR